MVIKIDPSRLNDPEIAAEGERDRMKALADRFSREDLMRAFDLLSRTESEIRYSSQPRHHFEMALLKWIHLRQLTPLTELIAGGGVPAAPRSGMPAPPPRSAAPAAPKPPPRPPAPAPAPAAPAPAPPAPAAAASINVGVDLRTALLAQIREHNKTFFGMVVAQAQSIAVEGDTVVFTFAPAHKGLRTQLEGRRGWIEQLAQAIAGRKIAVVGRDGQAAPADPAVKDSAARQSDLRAKIKNEPMVQSVLDVFGGEIGEIEEN
jgi:DNA polymerase III gamma/tau subunit